MRVLLPLFARSCSVTLAALRLIRRRRTQPAGVGAAQGARKHTFGGRECAGGRYCPGNGRPSLGCNNLVGTGSEAPEILYGIPEPPVERDLEGSSEGMTPSGAPQRRSPRRVEASSPLEQPGVRRADARPAPALPFCVPERRHCSRAVAQGAGRSARIRREATCLGGCVFGEALCPGGNHASIFVPSSSRNLRIQAGCAGQAGAVTRLPSTTALE